MYEVEYTCTSSDTVVTTNSITAVSPSTVIPNGISRSGPNTAHVVEAW
jgi:hypothetical protein